MLGGTSRLSNNLGSVSTDTLDTSQCYDDRLGMPSGVSVRCP